MTRAARLVALAGTPGETYLLARGVSDPRSPDLLFHPDLPDFDRCLAGPATGEGDMRQGWFKLSGV